MNVSGLEYRQDNVSPVLVFGLTGRTGSGVSFVRDKIVQEITTYGYRPIIVKVTKVILENLFEQFVSKSNFVDSLTDEQKKDLAIDNINLSDLSPKDRINHLQKRGNYLRREYGSEVIAKLVSIDVIYEELRSSNDLNPNKYDQKIAFVIDSLKHPFEIFYLRKIFGESFYSVGVVSSDAKRHDRLDQRKNINSDEFKRISDTDGDEIGEESGQKSIASALLADYFFQNNHATKDEIENEASRFLKLIFNSSITTPREDEIAMNIAFKASFQSACLSRQVGAVISSSGRVIATGCNDVPEFGGGLYKAESKNDNRCYSWGGKCYNDQHKIKIINELVADIASMLALDNHKTEELKELVSKSKIKRLIEFSRSIHAEMDALISLARAGIKGVEGATLYCTTYPCHNCAKHIVGSGIRRVVYLEPYEKSLATELHSDSINGPLINEGNKVVLEIYGGASPHKFELFFKKDTDRKKAGVFIDKDRHRSDLSPIVGVNIDVMVNKLKEAHQTTILSAQESSDNNSDVSTAYNRSTQCITNEL